MSAIVSIQQLSKTYPNGHRALAGINLDIEPGEIFALLGPNGAGKTTLIGSVCGLVDIQQGSITVGGHDVVREPRAARSLIGLVPQELTTDAFETVRATVAFSRGLFGRRPDPALIDRLLADLSLADKRDAKIRELSGGMKRRVMIAKALSHEPRVLFLDEPTAGVDVSLRQSMWELVDRLRADGVTIILTTHYIEEAERMADRIGVINRGQLLLVERTDTLMQRMGGKRLTVTLHDPLDTLPPVLQHFGLERSEDGRELTYAYSANRDEDAVSRVLHAVAAAGLRIDDLHTTQSSLEDIFVSLVAEQDQ